VFRIEILPAREGDCLIVSYGDADAPRRILIDGGRKGTYADLRSYLTALPTAQRQFELLIVSHVDRDHIEGILALFDDPDAPVSFRDVWFNGYHHLHEGDFETFSAVQGEALTAALIERVHQQQCAWNGAFGEHFQKAAALPADGALPEIALDGGMVLTLLSPSREKMQALIPDWEKNCRQAGIVEGHAAQTPPPEGFEFFAAVDIDALADEPFEKDTTRPNGSSIAVLATFAGKRALLAADAHPDLLEQSLGRLREGDAPLVIDAFKVPHHGSRKNLPVSLLQAVRCRNYLLSSNGAYFNHPDPVAMSRIIRYGGPEPRLWCNYASNETQRFDVRAWRQDRGYALRFPSPDRPGFQAIDL
jgi:beta-lactamase superfamily II metal-dependent hydrolase